MPGTRNGNLYVDPDTLSLIVEFKRHLPHRPRTVWDRLVDPAHLHEWLTYEPGSYIQHKTGGEVFLHTVGGAIIDTLVDAFDPPRVLAFPWETLDWDGGDIAVQLEAQDEGTILLFQHADDDHGPVHFAQLLANWHLALDRMEASLAGRPEAWTYEAWEERYLLYGSVFGTDPT